MRKIVLLVSLSLAALSLLAVAPTASACTIDLGSCTGHCVVNGVGSTCDGWCLVNGVYSHCDDWGTCWVNGVLAYCNGSCLVNIALTRC